MFQPKICTIGSMTVDLFIRPQEAQVMRLCAENTCDREYMLLPYGGKVKAGQSSERFGGGAHNTAIGLHRQGFNTCPIGKIGHDSYGKSILQNIENEGVSSTALQIDEAEQSGFSVILNSFEGERTVIYHPGANEQLNDFDPAILDDCDGLFFNRVSSSAADEHIFPQIKKHFLNFPEKFLAWNPGKEQLRQGALAFADFFPVVDILILNREEAELFTNRKAHKSQQEENSVQKGAHFCKHTDNDFPHYAADYADIFRVFQQQGVRHVVITDGRRGAQLCDGKDIYFCAIDDQTARVDTLGAGDAFGVGLFAALFHQKPLSFALKCATMNAASVVAQLGAQPGLLSSEALGRKTETTELFQTQKPLS